MGAELPERLCGVEFGRRGLEVIRDEIARAPQANRAEIARRVCRALGWFNDAGRPKAMGARVVLLRLARAGFVELPPPRHHNGNGSWRWQRRAELPIGLPRIGGRVEQITELTLELVSDAGASRLWNALMAHHHYLGYTPLVGAQLRYLIRSPLHGVLGCFGFGAAAWKVAARDHWIGWDRERRERNLARVLNNARFLILPEVRVKNLASHTLALAARRVVNDFEWRYAIRPLLLETFVERARHRGTCYRAANWHWVGTTQGRGKLDRHHEHRLPVKDVYLYPLTPRFREELTGGAP